MSGAVCRLGQGQLELRRDFKTLLHIAQGIKDLASGVSYAVLEAVHAMPGQGVCSMFSFGRAAGVIDGAYALALPETVPVSEISPQRWQNWFRATLGIPKTTAFDSRAIAIKLFPSYAHFFKRKLDHNSADAVLLAAYKLSNI